MQNKLRKFAMILICLTLFQACTRLTPSQNNFSGTPHFPLRWYQGPLNHLAAVRRGQCPMHPSCSEYSSQAIARHGLVLGWMMTTDRLMRCGRDEMKFAQRVLANGNWKFYDPVEYNDFWWYKEVGQRTKK
jgi:putative component of membrane protein insertase Oxa1/YidC/SpoIIIJ protein YidD